ncbi:MAG: hypothetical protein K8J08_21160 [Thermoanaerobaculia bacterium]|nr:hypothetical protein [Thermoanaerobaculia bacterium]
MTSRRSAPFGSLAAFIFAFALAISTIAPLAAAVFQVDRFDDPFPAQACDTLVPMDCSLREAVINANTTVGPDLILLPAGTYTLTRSGIDEDASFTGDLDLTDLVRIEGAGEALTIIDGGGPGGLGDRILDIHTSDAEIADLTVRGGSGVVRAGGIYNRGAMLTVERSTISSNRATGFGGGAQDAGTGTYVDTTFQDNEASRAGGLDVGGSTDFIDCRIVGNRALSMGDVGGGGVLTFGEGSLTRFIRTEISGNSSGTDAGGIYAWGPIEIIDSMVVGNSAIDTGGGLFVTAQRSAIIKGSTFSGNLAGFLGGAIDVEGQIEMTNSTLSGNQAGTAAGGIRVAGIGTLTNVTISRNTSAVGTAMMNTMDSTMTYRNTIFEGSCNAAPTVTSLGGNIESPGASCQLAGSDLVNVSASDLNLTPLGYYGGPTATHVPLQGSLAIDGGTACPPPDLDQRGGSRPIDGDGVAGAQCDVGAVEAMLNEYPWLFADGFESGSTSAWP